MYGVLRAHSLMGGSAREVTGGRHFRSTEPRHVAFPYGGWHFLGTACMYIQYINVCIKWSVCMHVCKNVCNYIRACGRIK